MADIYERLARHLEPLLMGYPHEPGLLELLRESFSLAEAKVALAIPNTLDPLQTADLKTIAGRSGLEPDEAGRVLESLAARGLVFSAPSTDGSQGYGLLQVGYGMPQTFFWANQKDENARRMAKLVIKYFTPKISRQIYGGRPTKTFRYSPAALAIDAPMQGALPGETMEPIVAAAQKIAVAHCPCRVSARILGRTDCTHSLEVCLKYDEMAEFVIDRGLARPISADEALSILKACEKEGLVHMVDNAVGEIKHTCNCCGHYCWNVGVIRRRKIPRDALMASYFIRQTEEDGCVGCGACVDICPVDAVSLKDEKAVVDNDWCIGCGVCAVACPAGAVGITRRTDMRPPETFSELTRRLREEKEAEG